MGTYNNHSRTLKNINEMREFYSRLMEISVHNIERLRKKCASQYPF